MKTEKLTIRKMTTEDLFPLYHVLSDPEVMEYLESPFSMEAAKQFLYKAGICETPLIWAVEDARKVFIGYVIYHTYDETSMELGWVLDRKEWGKGYASAITKMVTEESGSSGKELVIECSPEQKATKRIAQKYGFQFCSVVNGCEVYRLRRK